MKSSLDLSFKYIIMNKTDVRNELLNHQMMIVADLNKMVQQLRDSADIDEESTVKDIDDFARANEDNEKRQNLEMTLRQAENDLELLKNIEIGESDRVSLGAIVETENKLFYVSIPSTSFELDGKHFIGISTHAPIYLAMKDKKIGEQFQIGKYTYKIIAIY